MRSGALGRPARLVGLLLVGLAAVCGTGSAEGQPRNAFAPAEVTTRPIARFDGTTPTTRFGDLEYLGGLVLTSAEPGFGGWSGIDIDPVSGLMVLVSDLGRWMIARPVLAGGRLTGLAEARIARMLDPAGRLIPRKSLGDAESVRILPDGRTVLVLYEDGARLRRFRATPTRLAGAVPTDVAIPADARRREKGAGLEAVAVAPAGSALEGAIVLIGERRLNRAGDERAWILDGPRKGEFAIRRTGVYDVTDAAFLPDGDLLILERRLGLTEGLGMRIRRIAGGAIVPGATVDGATLIEADLRHEIDNMEGLAVQPLPGGGAVLYVLSDDNRNFIQRTLLLQFRLDR